MKTEEIYITKQFDNGNYMVEVKTNSEGGLIVDLFYQHMSGDWEFEDTILVDLNDVVTEV
jgi:hypothetical protein